MANKLIIFDCFGVLFEDIAPPFLKKHLGEEKAAAIKDSLFVPADLGEISYDQLLDNMSKAIDIDKEEMIKEWNSMFVVRSSIIPVIKKLKEK